MENNNRTWEALSMKDRASFIKLAIQNGYRDLDSIRHLYGNGGNSKNPTDDTKARVEYIMRESEGTQGQPWKKGTIKAYNAKNAEIIPEDRGYNRDNAYTGAVINYPWNHPFFNPDNRDEYLLMDSKDLIEELGHRPTDFVDAYVNNDIPFSELGVIEDRDKGEKRLLKRSITSNMNPKIYRSHKDTLDKKTVKYLDTQLQKGLPNEGDNFIIRNTNDHPDIFRLGNSNIGYDGQKVTAVHVKQPDGRIAYKLVDLYDFNPEHWSAFTLEEGKKTLQYLQDNGNPYIMASPWFYKPEWDKKIEQKFYKKFLGGPLYNEDNPIEGFQGNPYIPIVRY